MTPRTTAESLWRGLLIEQEPLLEFVDGPLRSEDHREVGDRLIWAAHDGTSLKRCAKTTI